MDEESTGRCSECGVYSAALEYGMCSACANSEWDSETLTLRPRIDKDAEISALRAEVAALRERLNAFAQASMNVDWRQVLLNGGPPCFHIEGGMFCLRAERWEGHGIFHAFASIYAAIEAAIDAACLPLMEDEDE